MHHPKLGTTSSTLADAQMQFQLWRSSKISGGRIPEALWELVATLLVNKSLKRSVIGKTLGISTSQLRNKFPHQIKSKSKSAVAAVTAKKHQPFVEARLNTLLAPPPSSAQLVIERTDGTKLIVSAVTQEQLSVLIKTFME